MASSGRTYLERPVPSTSPSCGTKLSPPAPQTQVSLQSPKMSPDSTLTHYHPPSNTTPSSATPVSHFSSGSSAVGQCASSCASSSSSLGDGFLRSALTSAVNTDNLNNSCLKLSNLNESHTVGSSTGNGLSVLGSMSSAAKVDANSAAMMAMMMRPRAMTAASNPTRSMTPTKNTSIAMASSAPVSAPTPSSTTPVKKSSRRNPWGSETYSDLISIAIHSYPDQQATLQQIYDFIISNYEYFRERSDPTSSAGWKVSLLSTVLLQFRLFVHTKL
ncbi:unnamed protein product [Echinostoma caproni]|uniref:Fork-head domain-containing protein n=1 Tax=Echinostoma caproni TaxID=27848 RepID=A0A183AV37_9TREM|nr:unnamed protein product [Echinostoma caproni]